MGYKAEIIADSLAPCGKRLTTFEVTFPRFILAEVNTHRQLSRNSASSRAIPIEKRIAAVMADPFIPAQFGRNQKGMQAGAPLEGQDAARAEGWWLMARDEAVNAAQGLARLGVHKQYANRLLEPFLWHTAILSATEWSNFFALRCHPDAQPEFKRLAELMRDAYDGNAPKCLNPWEWHLPYVQEDEQDTCSLERQIALSVARCARVSYLTHDGVRDQDKDLELYARLLDGGHLSPFEHVARPLFQELPSGNFIGWHQWRKDIPGECK